MHRESDLRQSGINLGTTLKPLSRWRQICRLIGLLMFVFLLAGLLGNVSARLWWVSDLTLHFPAQAAIWGLLTALLAACGGRKHLACGSLLIVTWHLAFIAPLYWGRHTVSQPATSQPFKVMAFNIYAHNDRYADVAALLKRERPDVLCIEELTTAWDREIRHHFPYRFAIPNDGSFGGGIYSQHPLTDPVTIPLSAGNISVQATVNLPSGPVRVVVVHAFPAVSALATELRNEQIQSLIAHLQSLEGPVIVLGDFNSSVWSWPLSSLTRQTGLFDSSRGFGLQTTWPAHNLCLRVPIDHVFVSSELEVVNRCIGPFSGSDHAPVIVECYRRSEL